MKFIFPVLFLLTFFTVTAQEPAIQTQQDTTATRKEKKKNPFKTGFYPVSIFDFDLKYIIKINNYEGIRLGLGGVTNDKLSETFKIGGYVARGFKDRAFKYSVGGSYRLNKERKTWVNLYYRSDINEIGSYNYLTDARVYSVFEPRLVNVTQFYKIKTWQSNLQTTFTKKILAEGRIDYSRINQIEDYNYISDDGELFNEYEITEATVGVRISPKTEFFTNEDGRVEYFDGLPKISAQITQGIAGPFDSDFNYTKFGLKLDYYIKRTDLSSTNFLLEGKYAVGDIPLTHLYHAYPNSPTKDEILQRFSVAGIRSFETMYFGEFFSDRVATFQVKHSLRRFYISRKIKPELVFISRHAIGNISNREQHLGIPFSTLDQGYHEAGMELNKIFFGFGLSFAYRYGAYHLPNNADNIAFKFTFNLKV